MSNLIKIKLPQDGVLYGKVINTTRFSNELIELHMKGYAVYYDSLSEQWVVSESTGWKYKEQKEWKGFNQFWRVFKTRSKTKAIKVAKFLAKMLDTEED